MSSMASEVDVVVAGSGVAGLSVAAECAERGLSVLCVDPGGLPGGVVANLGRVDGFPSAVPLSGAALADLVAQRGVAAGVLRLDGEVGGLAADAGGWRVALADGRSARARAVVVATGAALRRLGIPGEREFEGRGVSQCDWCDGGFFKQQAVAVVGGGNAAFQAALHLATLCSEVHLVIRGGIRALRSYVGAAGQNERIVFHWERVSTAILGSQGVEAVELEDVASGARETLAVQGVFVFAGTVPTTGWLPASLRRDAQGVLVTGVDHETELPGVYAVGAARSGFQGALVSACGDAAYVAARIAARLDN